MNPVILIADGQAQTYESLCEYFGEDVYDFLHVETADDAREVLAGQAVDIVIADVECSGTELLIDIAERWPRSWRILLAGEPDIAPPF